MPRNYRQRVPSLQHRTCCLYLLSANVDLLLLPVPLDAYTYLWHLTVKGEEKSVSSSPPYLLADELENARLVMKFSLLCSIDSSNFSLIIWPEVRTGAYTTTRIVLQIRFAYDLHKHSSKTNLHVEMVEVAEWISPLYRAEIPWRTNCSSVSPRVVKGLPAAASAERSLLWMHQNVQRHGDA